MYIKKNTFYIHIYEREHILHTYIYDIVRNLNKSLSCVRVRVRVRVHVHTFFL